VLFNSEISAECKVLLISIIRRFGVVDSFSIDISTIVKEHFSTKNTVVELFKLLKKSGYVLTKAEYRLRGKGKNIYSFTQSFIDALECDLFIHNAWKSDNPAIDILMKNELTVSRQCDKDNKVFLRSSNRLFLIIFILQADDFGVISNLSNTEISKLMGGISRDRFKSQLKTLYGIGVMNCHVSGVTGKELFGKVKGTFFLDLTHPLFDNKKPKLSSLKLNFNSIIDGIESTEATALHLTYKTLFNLDGDYIYVGPLGRFNYSPLIAGNVKNIEIKRILPLFKSKALHDQLQLHLLDNASEMLSSHWSNLDEDVSTKTIKDSAWLKIVPTTKRESFDNGDSEFYELKSLIISLSFRIARRYKSLMQSFLGADFKPVKVLIVPHGKYGFFNKHLEVIYSGSVDGKVTNVLVDDKSVKINSNDKGSEVDRLLTVKEMDKILLS
jgi:hypothetical protein